LEHFLKRRTKREKNKGGGRKKKKRKVWDNKIKWTKGGKHPSTYKKTMFLEEGDACQRQEWNGGKGRLKR